MYTKLEIEFKSQITQTEYETLMKKYGLENKIIPQTNFYFDTPNYDLQKNKIALRIRQKEHSVKLTAKVKQKVGTLERHIILDEDKALHMIENGFNANVIGVDYNVVNFAQLTTLRAKIPFKSGIIFFDKSIYYDVVDYEVEFEVEDIEKGKVEFYDFLLENNLTYKPIVSKTKRAYEKTSLKK